jgi:hypothetical protein
VGLIPENELSRKAGVKLDPVTSGPYVDETFQTNVPGIFAAGNVVHVYDLVDWVSEAGFSAGKSAAKFAIALRNAEARYTPLIAGKNVRYVVPHKLDKSTLEQEDVRLQMRVTRPIEQPVWVEVHDGENLITRKAERYVRPGEMVTVILKTKNYADVAKSRQLTIDINPR